MVIVSFSLENQLNDQLNQYLFIVKTGTVNWKFRNKVQSIFSTQISCQNINKI